MRNALPTTLYDHDESEANLIAAIDITSRITSEATAYHRNTAGRLTCVRSGTPVKHPSQLPSRVCKDDAEVSRQKRQWDSDIER
jgi:hypothetical protein